MKLFGVLMVALLVVGMTAGTARAEEEEKVVKKIVVTCGEDGKTSVSIDGEDELVEKCLSLCSEGYGEKTCIIMMNEDGEEKLIKVKAGAGMLDLDGGGGKSMMMKAGHGMLGMGGGGGCKSMMMKAGHGMHGTMGMKGPCHMIGELEPGTRDKLLDEKIKYVRATAGLKTDLVIAGIELCKLQLAETPNDDHITAKKKRIAALKAKMEQKKLDHELAVRKLLPEGMDDMLFDCDFDVDASGPHKMIKRIEVIVDDEEEDED